MSKTKNDLLKEKNFEIELNHLENAGSANDYWAARRQNLIARLLLEILKKLK